jgi:hypothetical protein
LQLAKVGNVGDDLLGRAACAVHDCVVPAFTAWHLSGPPSWSLRVALHAFSRQRCHCVSVGTVVVTDACSRVLPVLFVQRVKVAAASLVASNPLSLAAPGSGSVQAAAASRRMLRRVVGVRRLARRLARSCSVGRRWRLLCSLARCPSRQERRMRTQCLLVRLCGGHAVLLAKVCGCALMYVRCATDMSKQQRADAGAAAAALATALCLPQFMCLVFSASCAEGVTDAERWNVAAVVLSRTPVPPAQLMASCMSLSTARTGRSVGAVTCGSTCTRAPTAPGWSCGRRAASGCC